MRTAREKRNEEQTCRVQTDTGTTSDGQTRPNLPSLYEQGVVDEARLPATPTILLVWFGVMLKRKARIVNGSELFTACTSSPIAPCIRRRMRSGGNLTRRRVLRPDS